MKNSTRFAGWILSRFVPATVVLLLAAKTASAEMITLNSGERLRADVVRIEENGTAILLFADGAVEICGTRIGKIVRELNLEPVCIETIRELERFAPQAISRKVLTLAEFEPCENPLAEKALVEGRRFLAIGLTGTAIGRFQKAVQIEPDFAAAHVDLASAYIACEKFKLAEGELDLARFLGAAKGANAVGAQLYIRIGDIDKARGLLLRRIKSEYYGPEAIYRYFRFWLEQGVDSEVGKAWDKYVEADPELKSPWCTEGALIRHGALEFELGNFGRAIEFYETALENNPFIEKHIAVPVADAREGKVKEMVGSGKLVEAVAELYRLASLPVEPERVESTIRWAGALAEKQIAAYLVGGELEALVEFCAETGKRFPAHKELMDRRTIDAYEYFAGLRLDAGEFKAAVDIAGRLAEFAPRKEADVTEMKYAAHIGLAEAAIQVDEKVNYYRKAAALKPSERDEIYSIIRYLYVALAGKYEEVGDFEGAVECYDKLLGLFSDRHEYVRAREEALYKRALARDREHFTPEIRLAAWREYVEGGVPVRHRLHAEKRVSGLLALIEAEKGESRSRCNQLFRMVSAYFPYSVGNNWLYKGSGYVLTEEVVSVEYEGGYVVAEIKTTRIEDDAPERKTAKRRVLIGNGALYTGSPAPHNIIAVYPFDIGEFYRFAGIEYNRIFEIASVSESVKVGDFTYADCLVIAYTIEGAGGDVEEKYRTVTYDYYVSGIGLVKRVNKIRPELDLELADHYVESE